MARAIDILFFLFSVATVNRGVDAYPSAPVLAAECQMTPDVKLPRAGIFEAYRMMMQEVGNDQQTNGVSAVASFRLLAAAVTFGAAFVAVAITMNRSVNIYDEGIILTGAMRVAQGPLPHRDFYANYGPGQFFVLAAIFKLFDPSIFVERIWDLAVKAGIVCLVNAIASGLMGRLFATAAPADGLRRRERRPVRGSRVAGEAVAPNASPAFRTDRASISKLRGRLCKRNPRETKNSAPAGL